MGTLTIGAAVHKYRQNRRTEEIKPTITAELFSRLNEDNPSWDEWVDGLSVSERTAVRDTGKRLLQQVDGDERVKLQQLIAVLGFDPEHIQNDLESDDLYRTLRGLSWLALLEYPSVVDTALRTCTWNQNVRTATARVLYENEDPRARRTGVDLLLWDGRNTLSVFGLDTLYRIVTRDPDYLLSIANDEHGDWDEGVLIQVLVILQYGQSSTSPSSLAWVPACLDHNSPEVRAAALSTLAEYGWSQQLRDMVDINEHITDPSPEVRRVAYHVLDQWNGDLEELATAVHKEPDDLARLVGVRVLYTQDGWERPRESSSEAFEQTWRWIDAERRLIRRPA